MCACFVFVHLRRVRCRQDRISQLLGQIAGLEEDNRILAHAAGWEMGDTSVEVRFCASPIIARFEYVCVFCVVNGEPCMLKLRFSCLCCCRSETGTGSEVVDHVQ